MTDFLDSFKLKLNAGVSTVTIKAKELADSNRIKGQVSTLEKQKQSALMDLARAVCAMLDGQGLEDDVLRAARRGISDLDSQIAQQEAELVRIHEEAQLALSGGRPAPSPAAPARVHTCGAAIVENAKFCTACGKPINP